MTTAIRSQDSGASLPETVLVDLDGTLALRTDRSPFDFGRVAEDLPNAPIVALVLALKHVGFEILVVSGRDESCRSESERWLLGNLGFSPELLMRSVGDNRPDFVVKNEIYRNLDLSKRTILMAIDDRQQCVNLWRGLGIVTLQVADGDF